jgi:hypothetical protein
VAEIVVEAFEVIDVDHHADDAFTSVVPMEIVQVFI